MIHEVVELLNSVEDGLLQLILHRLAIPVIVLLLIIMLHLIVLHHAAPIITMLHLIMLH